jgi:hypothetical protein
VFFDTGFGPCDAIAETTGTAPPLDAWRRDSVGIEIAGRVASATPRRRKRYSGAQKRTPSGVQPRLATKSS